METPLPDFKAHSSEARSGRWGEDGRGLSPCLQWELCLRSAHLWQAPDLSKPGEGAFTPPCRCWDTWIASCRGRWDSMGAEARAYKLDLKIGNKTGKMSMPSAMAQNTRSWQWKHKQHHKRGIFQHNLNNLCFKGCHQESKKIITTAKQKWEEVFAKNIWQGLRPRKFRDLCRQEQENEQPNLQMSQHLQAHFCRE